MAQPQQNLSLTAPAFQGINSEDSPLSQDVTFAAKADNAVIDRYGRLGSRKGFKSAVTSYDTSRITPPVGWASLNARTHSVAHSSGQSAVFGMVVDWLDGSDVVLQTTYQIGIMGIDQVVHLIDLPFSASNLAGVKGQIVPFTTAAGVRYVLFSGGGEVIINAGAYSATLASDDAGWYPPQDGATENTNIFSATMNGDVACGAYGRLWVSGVEGNYQRIYYSSLENPVLWYDGTADQSGGSQNTGGIIDVSQYWPNGRDEIMGIAAHNNMLVVFGRHSILLYGNPVGDPAAVGGIFLQDAIEGMGLISRDAVCSTGQDILFVDDSGVRSLGRSVQEQSVPVGDLTANVRTEFVETIRDTQDVSSISLSYWAHEGFAVCNFANRRQCYVLDLRRPSSTGGSRITTWSDVSFDRAIHVDGPFADTMLLGSNDFYGVLEYTGGYDIVSNTYKFTYKSNPLGFGDNVRQKFPKRMDITVVSQNSDTVANARWGFGDELKYSKQLTIDALIPAYWGQAQYGIATYGPGAESVKRYRVNTKGSGALVVLGMEATLDGGFFSIQELNIQTLLGRIY